MATLGVAKAAWMFSIVPTPELHEATALFSPSAQGAAHLASVPMIAIPIPIQTPYAPDGPVFDFLLLGSAGSVYAAAEKADGDVCFVGCEK